jgi:hypothetical protein
MEGVLGSVHSRSTKTPRPLLNLRNELRTEREQHASVLMLIESAFDRILLIEDVDKLLRSAERTRMTPEKIAALSAKRVEIVQDLFCYVPLFTLDGSTEQPEYREDAVCAWEEDQPLLKFLNTQKGRKMIARLIPLLPSFYSHGLLLFFMRNFSLILGILDQFPDESSQRLLPSLVGCMALLDAQQIEVGLQVLSHFHNNDRLLSILQTKNGAILLTSMFQQVYIQLSEPVSSSQHQSQLMAMRQQWFSTVDLYFRRFVTRFASLFDTKETDRFVFYHTLLVLFLTWANHVGPQHHKVLITEIA